MPFIYRTAALTTALLLGAAAPAHADWEATRWGMSPDEALAVLDGALAHDPIPAEIYEEAGKGYAPLVKMDHAIEGIEGQLSLLFDAEERLRFVLFKPDTLSQCDALGAALTERLGPVDAIGTGSLSISDWVAGGNKVKLTSYADAGICNLSYSGT